MTRTSAAQKKLGAELRRGREARRLSQDDVAQAVGRSRKTVSAWESGTIGPSALTLLTLARFLRLSVPRLARAVERKIA